MTRRFGWRRPGRVWTDKAATRPRSTPDRPAPPEVASPPDPAWRSLTPMQRTGSPFEPVVALDRFAADLRSHHDPSFLAPLSHRRSLDGPAGRMDGLIHPGVPVQVPTDPVPEPRPAQSQRSRPKGPLTRRLQRLLATPGTGLWPSEPAAQDAPADRATTTAQGPAESQADDDGDSPSLPEPATAGPGNRAIPAQPVRTPPTTRAAVDQPIASARAQTRADSPPATSSAGPRASPTPAPVPPPQLPGLTQPQAQPAPPTVVTPPRAQLPSPWALPAVVAQPPTGTTTGSAEHSAGPHRPRPGGQGPAGDPAPPAALPIGPETPAGRTPGPHRRMVVGAPVVQQPGAGARPAEAFVQRRTVAHTPPPMSGVSAAEGPADAPLTALAGHVTAVAGVARPEAAPVPSAATVQRLHLPAAPITSPGSQAAHPRLRVGTQQAGLGPVSHGGFQAGQAVVPAAMPDDHTPGTPAAGPADHTLIPLQRMFADVGRITEGPAADAARSAVPALPVLPPQAPGPTLPEPSEGLLPRFADDAVEALGAEPPPAAGVPDAMLQQLPDAVSQAAEDPVAAASGAVASFGEAAAAGIAASLPTGRYLDELARRLYEPLSAQLRAEFWLDRERSGLMVDPRR